MIFFHHLESVGFFVPFFLRLLKCLLTPGFVTVFALPVAFPLLLGEVTE